MNNSTVSTHCRVCGEPMSERYRAEQAHHFHEEGCPNHGRVEYAAACDCAGYVHPWECPCELEHPEEP